MAVSTTLASAAVAALRGRGPTAPPRSAGLRPGRAHAAGGPGTLERRYHRRCGV